MLRPSAKTYRVPQGEGSGLEKALCLLAFGGLHQGKPRPAVHGALASRALAARSRWGVESSDATSWRVVGALI